MTRTVRSISALALTAVVVAALAACSPPASNLASCVSPYSAGDNSDAITASGKLGALPTVQFPTPIVATDAQVTVLEQGDGAVAYPTNAVEYTYSAFDPTTGEAAGDSGFDTPSLNVVTDNLFSKFTQCATAGTRLAVVADAVSIFGSVDAANQAGVDSKAVLVAVIDVLDTFPGKANGWDQLPQAGVPSIVLAPDGQPGFIIPNADPPTDLKVAVLKAGTGPTVKAGDSVVLQYSGITWTGSSPFDSTWGKGPVQLTADTSGLVQGFVDAIVGKQVGSQIVAVIPPELGYGDQDQQSIPAGSTLVFVIDILKIESGN